MNILELIPGLGKPRGTSAWTWSCWGDSAQYIDWGGEENHLASAVFDRETGDIYCVEIYTGAEALRYIEPEFREEYQEECQRQGVDYLEPAPGIVFTEVTNPQIILATVATLNTYDPT